MGNENSKNKAKNEGLEIIDDGEVADGKKRKQIVDMNSAIENIKAEIIQQQSDTDEANGNKNNKTNDQGITKLKTTIMNHVDNSQPNGNHTEVNTSVVEKLLPEVGMIVAEEVTKLRPASDNEKVNNDAREPDLSNSNGDNVLEIKIKEKKKSKKDKDLKKKEKLSKKEKKPDKKFALKEGKPATVMVDNETYSNINYVPCQDNISIPNGATEPKSPENIGDALKCVNPHYANKTFMNEHPVEENQIEIEATTKTEIENKQDNFVEHLNEDKIEDINFHSFSTSEETTVRQTVSSNSKTELEESVTGQDENKCGTSYLLEAIGLINETHNSIPSSNQTDNTTLESTKISHESDILMTSSYRKESQTITNDSVIDKLVLTKSHEISTNPQNNVEINHDAEEYSTDQLTMAAEVNRVVNNTTVTEVVNDGESVSITITTISNSELNDDLVLNNISSTINNNLNETVVLTNTVDSVNACQGSDVNSSEFKISESDSKHYISDICDTNAEEVENIPEQTESSTYIATSNNSYERALDPSESPKGKDRKKQKAEEKKSKKVSKKKDKSVKEKRKLKGEELEISDANIKITKSEEKKSGNKMLKISTSKSDEERKNKKKKKDKKEKDTYPISPVVDAETEFTSPIKGIFDDVPIEIEVNDVDTVSLSSLSSDEAERTKQTSIPDSKSPSANGSNTNKVLLNVQMEDSSASRPNSEEYVTLFNVHENFDENRGAEIADGNSDANLEKDNTAPENVTESIKTELDIKNKSEPAELVQESPPESPEIDIESSKTDENKQSASKKKSKKESKKKRSSKLFSFHSKSEVLKEPKEISHLQQEISLNQDPQSDFPKERRRSFSEFLRPVFGNIFSKSSPTSSSKRKSKIEVEDETPPETTDLTDVESKE